MMIEYKFLTENEKLFETISFNRLKKIIKREDIEVINYNRDSNSYGEFLFITCKVGNNKIPIVFYGFGMHEYRGEYYVSKWRMYEGNQLEKENLKPVLQTKIELLRYLNLEFKKWEKIKQENPVEKDNTFCMIADMADEDYALSNYY